MVLEKAGGIRFRQEGRPFPCDERSMERTDMEVQGLCDRLAKARTYMLPKALDRFLDNTLPSGCIAESQPLKVDHMRHVKPDMPKAPKSPLRVILPPIHLCSLSCVSTLSSTLESRFPSLPKSTEPVRHIFSGPPY